MRAPTAAAVATVESALAELLARGYSLSVETRVHVHDHKVGAHPITYAERLLVVGPERVPDHLRKALVEDKPLFLAAACILDSPTPWIRDLVQRCRTGDRQAGCQITPEVLAANLACFVGLSPSADTPRLSPVVRAALSAPGVNGNG